MNGDPKASPTSNVQSLLEDLRNDDRVSMQHTAWLEERAVTEIERLTRELEEGRKYSVERGNLLGAVSHQGAEIQRLRAALERIAKDEPDHLAHEVARRALSGEPSPDETGDELPLDFCVDDGEVCRVTKGGIPTARPATAEEIELYALVGKLHGDLLWARASKSSEKASGDGLTCPFCGVRDSHSANCDRPKEFR